MLSWHQPFFPHTLINAARQEIEKTQRGDVSSGHEKDTSQRGQKVPDE